MIYFIPENPTIPACCTVIPVRTCIVPGFPNIVQIRPVLETKHLFQSHKGLGKVQVRVGCKTWGEGIFQVVNWGGSSKF